MCRRATNVKSKERSIEVNMKNLVCRFLGKISRRLGLERRVIKAIKVPVLMDKLLVGRRALITGGSRGIGRAIARAFLNSGCEVVITGRDALTLKATADELSKIGPRVSYKVLDNSQIVEFPMAVEDIRSEFGEIDILVNNAGFTRGGTFLNSSEDGYDQVFDGILKGSWFLSQEIAKRWCENGIRGNILNICSTSSLRPGYSPYTMCKNAERAMTVGMAKKLIRYGIVVNGAGPGVTAVERIVGDPNGDIAHAKNPSGRYATEEEIANIALVLVSDMGRMIVGDVVYVGGGAGVITFDDV